jgi:broad specificity phosphatase PhoE
MKSLTLVTIAFLILSMGLINCSSNTDKVSSGVEYNPLVLFLVRHGEKVDNSDDAQLSAPGQERAIILGTILRSAEIEHVHSSDFIRTRDTATPTAAGYGLELEVYDHQDLPALVEKIRRMGGRHLVVGHSTTTPAMAGLLGGKPGPAINDESEYDRLYIVTVGSDGNVSTVMMRYGI